MTLSEERFYKPNPRSSPTLCPTRPCEKASDNLGDFSRISALSSVTDLKSATSAEVGKIEPRLSAKRAVMASSAAQHTRPNDPDAHYKMPGYSTRSNLQILICVIVRAVYLPGPRQDQPTSLSRRPLCRTKIQPRTDRLLIDVDEKEMCVIGFVSHLSHLSHFLSSTYGTLRSIYTEGRLTVALAYGSALPKLHKPPMIKSKSLLSSRLSCAGTLVASTGYRRRSAGRPLWRSWTYGSLHAQQCCSPGRAQNPGFSQDVGSWIPHSP